MMTVDEALDRVADKYHCTTELETVLAAEVRRLQAVEGECNNTCTRQILGEVCHGCRCGKTLPEPAP